MTSLYPPRHNYSIFTCSAWKGVGGVVQGRGCLPRAKAGLLAGVGKREHRSSLLLGRSRHGKVTSGLEGRWQRSWRWTSQLRLAWGIATAACLNCKPAKGRPCAPCQGLHAWPPKRPRLMFPSCKGRRQKSRSCMESQHQPLRASQIILSDFLPQLVSLLLNRRATT